MGHRIAEAAEVSGLPATTIRYYEDRGLVPAPERTANGYRTYTDRDVARLGFVARTRTLDLGVDDLAELVAVWEHDRCEPVADRLADKATAHLADTQRRIADLTALARRLRQAVTHLDRPAHDGPCGHDCVCLDEPDTPAAAPLPGPHDQADRVACTLEPARMADRVSDWQHLLDQATERWPITAGVTVRFPSDPDLARALIVLASAEHDCCSFFDFALHITADNLDLHVTGPETAQPTIATMFSPAGSTPSIR